MIIDQRFVDRIITRAQNSLMGLDAPDKPNAYDLSNYSEPHTIENVALLLVGAHFSKYDLVSLMAAAMEEVQLSASGGTAASNRSARETPEG